MPEHKIVIGKEEWVSLPELALPAIKARIDSGAKTSALHAFNIQPYEEDGVSYVQFEIHPLQQNRKVLQICRARVIDRREIKSSNGETERRYVIRTPLKLGDTSWDIDVTLTNRDEMGYRMLLGREAMTGRVLIDPDGALYLGNVNLREAKGYYQLMRREGDPLSLVLLASNQDLYSNRRIMEACEERGHKVEFVNLKHCYMNITSRKLEVYYRGGQSMGHVDAVIPRIRPNMTFYGCAVLRQFEAMGVYCLNDALPIARSRDKLRSLQMLSARGIPMPVTSFAHSPIDTADIIRMVGGAPVVVKLLEGTQGKGVVLAETQKAAESVINAFKSLQANILVQEYISEAGGKDIRCFVIDGKVVGAMQRQAANGEFRANLHLGGSASSIKVTAEERKVAVRAAKAMGLDVAGVDIIRSKEGPKVLEINSSPGLEGIEAITGQDIAGLMIECIEKRLTGHRKDDDASPYSNST
ncbi:MAG: 30S ribosomal protein S6--L-glutamate ligase [Alphaproteobacteria bacterium]|nr:MAG: 30S ribosomal protein S6--L-glutamate ligase [Alphaproteobacteria bacterium]